MSVTIRDAATAAELTAHPGTIEVLGPDGQVLGRFTPHLHLKLTDREVTERANRPDAKWYTPEQVMDRLREIDRRG